MSIKHKLGMHRQTHQYGSLNAQGRVSAPTQGVASLLIIFPVSAFRYLPADAVAMHLHGARGTTIARVNPSFSDPHCP